MFRAFPNPMHTDTAWSMLQNSLRLDNNKGNKGSDTTAVMMTLWSVIPQFPAVPSLHDGTPTIFDDEMY